MHFTEIAGTAPVARVSPCEQCSVPHCQFRALGPEVQNRRVITLTRGERLECRERGCLKFWIIKSGTAATCVSFSDGRRQIAAIENTGNTVCGPMANYGTEHWLEALDDLAVCEVDLSPEAADPSRNSAFMRSMFDLIHARLENALVLISMLGRLDSQERVTLFLAEMAARAGGERAIVSLPMSREDIADYLGLNTETVSRVFTRIRKSGLVRFLSPTEFQIPDMAAVARRLPVRIPGYDEGSMQ